MGRIPNQPATDHDKTTLERIKLEREIIELNKPLFRRPALYAILGPTLLAAGSLGLGAYTGIFDVQRERLANQKLVLEIEAAELTDEKEQLEIEKASLEADRAETSRELALAEANLALRSAEIETKLKEAQEELARQETLLRQQLDAERAKSTAEIAKLQDDIAMEKERLGEELQLLYGAIELAESELEAARKQLANERIISDLDALEDSNGPVWHRDPLKRLVSALKADPKIAAVLEERQQNTTNERLEAGILYIKFAADQTAANFAMLEAFLRQNANQLDAWETFAGLNFSASWQRRTLEVAAEILTETEVDPETFREFLIFFHEAKKLPPEALSKLRSEESFSLFSKGIETITNSGRSAPINIYVTNMFGFVDANLGGVFASLLATGQIIGDQNAAIFRAALDADIAAHVRSKQNNITYLEQSGMLAAYRSDDLEAWLEASPQKEIAAALLRHDFSTAFALAEN